MFFLSKSIYCGTHVPLTLALGMRAAPLTPRPLSPGLCDAPLTLALLAGLWAAPLTLTLRRQGCTTPHSPFPRPGCAASPRAPLTLPRPARSPSPAGCWGRTLPPSPFPAQVALPRLASRSPFPVRGFLTLPCPGCASPRSLTLSPWCALPRRRGGRVVAGVSSFCVSGRRATGEGVGRRGGTWVGCRWEGACKRGQEGGGSGREGCDRKDPIRCQ